MGARFFTAASALALALLGSAPARAEPAVWVVKDDDSTIYLLGTIHQLKPGLDWEGSRIGAVIAGCQDLTLEIADFDDISAIAPLIGRYGYDRDRRLADRLTPEENAGLARAAKAAGLAPAVLQPMKPWLAAVTLSTTVLQQAGYDGGDGVETRIRSEVKAVGRPVRSLETAEGQVRMLAGLSDEAQLEFLRSVLKGDAAEDFGALTEAWSRGDVDAVEAAVNVDMQKQTPQLYKAMFTDRNANFARQIKDMLLEKGPRCVALGAGHLAGPDSVQAQLKTLGVDTARY